MSRSWKQLFSSAGLAALLSVPGAAIAVAEELLTVTSRGQQVRALLQKVDKPVGAVVLLAGGHGNLRLSSSGAIGWGAGNQLVRSRAAYAKAGYITLVPDIAPDLKNGEGVKNNARWSSEFATDVGAHVAALRRLLAQAGATGDAARVHLIGTSRAALTVAKAATTITSGPGRPDTITITAGMVVNVGGDQPSAERNVGNLGRVTQPVLLVHHTQDGCAYTPASGVPRAKASFSGSKSVTVEMMSGGGAGSGNPCEANSHHGFLGQDQQVVDLVTRWLKTAGK